MTKKRDLNFELLRIISMILIISSHYVGHSGILEQVKTGTFNYYFINFILVAARISVNLYVLITGYYMINSKAKVKKLFNTWLVVEFYSIILLFISMINIKTVSFKEIVKALLPISSCFYWFATVYVALYVLTPFINKALKNLNKKQYQILMSILFIMLVLEKSIFNSNIHIDVNGESLIWFIYLYIVAGYIRLHYNKKVNKKLCFIVTLITPFIITAIRVISDMYFGKRMDALLNFSNILNFISTVCLFLYFKDVNIKNEKINNIIAKISPLIFGIYLIHDNGNINSFMWKNILKVNEYAESNYLILNYIISVILVFTVCSCIEFLRLKIFEMCSKTKLSKKTDEKLDKLDEKFEKIIMEV